jgi:hypothetical protein
MTAVLLSLQNDTYQFIPSAVLAGLITDLILGRAAPLDRASARVVRLVAFGVPAIYFGLYFVALAIADGMGWSIHLWLGSAVLAGVVGLLLSLLVVPPSTKPVA